MPRPGRARWATRRSRRRWRPARALDRGARLAELAAAHRPTSATSSARSSWALARDVAQAEDLDSGHRRDRGAAEELEPHRVTSSPAMAAAGATGPGPAALVAVSWSSLAAIAAGKVPSVLTEARPAPGARGAAPTRPPAPPPTAPAPRRARARRSRARTARRSSGRAGSPARRAAAPSRYRAPGWPACGRRRA